MTFWPKPDLMKYFIQILVHCVALMPVRMSTADSNAIAAGTTAKCGGAKIVLLPTAKNPPLWGPKQPAHPPPQAGPNQPGHPPPQAGPNQPGHPPPQKCCRTELATPPPLPPPPPPLADPRGCNQQPPPLPVTVTPDPGPEIQVDRLPFWSIEQCRQRYSTAAHAGYAAVRRVPPPPPPAHDGGSKCRIRGSAASAGPIDPGCSVMMDDHIDKPSFGSIMMQDHIVRTHKAKKKPPQPKTAPRPIHYKKHIEKLMAQGN